MDQKLTVLATVPLFRGLDRKDLEAIGRLCDEVDLPAGREIARQGESADGFYVILEGTVRIERDGQVLGDLGAGQFLGELAMLAKIPRTATATCQTPCRLLVLGHREFNGLLADYPTIQGAVLHALAERINTLQPDLSR
jgi:CRP-like cAMP-binding protein